MDRTLPVGAALPAVAGDSVEASAPLSSPVAPTALPIFSRGGAHMTVPDSQPSPAPASLLSVSQVFPVIRSLHIYSHLGICFSGNEVGGQLSQCALEGPGFMLKVPLLRKPCPLGIRMAGHLESRSNPGGGRSQLPWVGDSGEREARNIEGRPCRSRRRGSGK